jgi:hypothetical protein
LSRIRCGAAQKPGSETDAENPAAQKDFLQPTLSRFATGKAVISRSKFA